MKLYEHTIKRPNGSTFTLSADTQQGLADLIAMWQQPLSAWNGRFLTAPELAASKENTASIDLNKRSA